MMSGVRVHDLPKGVTEKHLKIYFSKPENGGGRIKKIYFPLFHNDAVILFDHRQVIEDVLSRSHNIQSVPVTIRSLPEHLMFVSLEAKLDEVASVLIQATQSLRDEMEFGENIRITEEEDGNYTLHGNWFQLEWAWHYIDCFMQQQEIIQHEIIQQPQHYASSPLELDYSEQLTYNTTGSPHAGSRHIGPALTGSRHSGSHLSDADTAGSRHTTTEHTGSLHPGSQHTATGSRQAGSDLTGSPQSGSRHTGSRQAGSDLTGSPHSGSRHTGSHQAGSDLTGSPRTGSRHSGKLSDRGTDVRYKECKTSLDEAGCEYDMSRLDIAEERTHTAIRPSVHPTTSPTSSLLSLKQNITTSYTDQTVGDGADSGFRNRPPTPTSATDSDPDLHGVGFPLPASTMHSLPDEYSGRSDDQRQTFQEFTGLELQAVRDGGNVGDQGETGRSDLKPNRANQSADEEENVRMGGDGSSGVARSIHSQPDTVNNVESSMKPSPSHHLPDHYTEDQLLRTFNIKGVKVTIYYGDLLLEDADAIVNAANENLDHNGGIAYAILKARGSEMQDDCDKYKLRRGPLATTQVMHTSGGNNIRATHIIHAAGPMWLTDLYQQRFTSQLIQTFLNCFKYANERLWIKTLAMPVLSSGIYGAPLDVCVRCFLDALVIFSHSEEQHRLCDIRLVNNDAESTVTSIVLIETLLETGITLLTQEALQVLSSTEVERKHPRSELNLPHGRYDGSSVSAGTDTRTQHHYDLTSSSLRRSSSYSRLTSKSPKSLDTTDRGGAAVRSGSFSSRLPSSSYSKQHHTVDKKAADRVDLSAGTSSTTHGGYQLYDDMKTTSSSTGRSSKAVPRMKQPLHSSDNLRVKSRTDRLLLSPRGGDLGATVPALHTSSMGNDDYTFGLHSLPLDLNAAHNTYSRDTSSSTTDKCAICLDTICRPKQLDCRHTFCSDCIKQHFKSSKPTCPICGTVYGRVSGDQPLNGEMRTETLYSKQLPGYERCSVIMITYTFPSGVQGANHPNPGKPYKGCTRKAYLPNNKEGQEILKLLKKAFEARLVFTIGESRTTGKTGVLTWNDIHHKTSMTGGPTKFGYPDSSYLVRVRGELAAKGIVSYR